jgi:hypothetical protein
MMFILLNIFFHFFFLSYGNNDENSAVLWRFASGLTKNLNKKPGKPINKEIGGVDTFPGNGWRLATFTYSNLPSLCGKCVRK